MIWYRLLFSKLHFLNCLKMMKATDKNFHIQSDRRQFGGMLMLLGFCAIIQPLKNVVSGFGPDGANETDPGEIAFWRLVGAFCLFITGIFAVVTGYIATVHDWSHQYITSILIVMIQVRTPLGQKIQASNLYGRLLLVGHAPDSSSSLFVVNMTDGVHSIHY